MKTVPPAADSDPRQTGWPCMGAHKPGRERSNQYALWTACSRCGLRLSYVAKGRHQEDTRAVGPPRDLVIQAQQQSASGVCPHRHEREDLPGQAHGGEGQGIGDFSWSRTHHRPSPCRRAPGTVDDERAAEDKRRKGKVGSDITNPGGAHRGDGTDRKDAQDSFETLHITYQDTGHGVISNDSGGRELQSSFQAHQEGEASGGKEEGSHGGGNRGADNLRRRDGELCRGGEDHGKAQEKPGQVSALWKALRNLQHRMRGGNSEPTMPCPPRLEAAQDNSFPSTGLTTSTYNAQQTLHTHYDEFNEFGTTDWPFWKV